jgi:tRNASer (uridine44-2'-O)-methyltransferase
MKSLSVADQPYLCIANEQPGIPLLSLIPTQPVPFLSLPCCLHTLDGPFTSNVYNPPPHPHTPEGGFDKGLEDGASRYKAYLMWLGWCGLMSGWMWEKEPLRIPSTKGWGIVGEFCMSQQEYNLTDTGRKRWAREGEDRECREWALEHVKGVRERGVFKVREKEGRDNH